MASIACPHCRGLLEDDGTLSGNMACPRCGGHFTINRSPSGSPALRPRAQAAPTPAIRASPTRRQPSPSAFDALLVFFDWRFERYLTPSIVRMMWLMALALAFFGILGAVLMMISPTADASPAPRMDTGFSFDPPAKPSSAMRWGIDISLRVIMAVVSIVVTLQMLLAARVACEFLIVIFQIAESLKSIDHKTRGP